MITITQGINDYYDKMRDVGRYLLENAEFVGLLKQRPKASRRLGTMGALYCRKWNTDSCHPSQRPRVL